MTATEIYLQSIDKQRILVIGAGSNLITGIIEHTLKFHHRKFDHISSAKPISIQSDSPIIIINNGPQPIDYKHHIIVFGYTASSDELSEFETLANATSKGGTIIYPNAHSALNKIGSKERPDVQSIAYEVCKHEVVEGRTVLISSTKERFPVQLYGDSDLQCLSAAKELLKKIGISSGNFYKAICEYKTS